MDPRLQRRVQRYGWDRAVDTYEDLWRAQLVPAHTALLDMAALAPGERVLDVASGTGLVTFKAAHAVGPDGSVLGIDLSGQMVATAAQRAEDLGVSTTAFARMDAEALDLPEAGFDVALCALGLMYAPDPERAVAEMRRVVRPGGRAVLAVWGARANCGWADLFAIVDAEVASEVCPLFFRLGQGEALADACKQAGFGDIRQRRISTTLDYADADAACDAGFIGGPAALAWSHFDQATRARVRQAYLWSLESWRRGAAYAVPGEFVIVSGVVPD